MTEPTFTELNRPGNFTRGVNVAHERQLLLRHTFAASARGILNSFFEAGVTHAVSSVVRQAETGDLNDKFGKAMAIVVLNPNLFDRLTTGSRQALLDEVQELWNKVNTVSFEVDGIDVWELPETMSEQLRDVLAETYAHSYVYAAHDIEGAPSRGWDMPYDFIASLKALNVLLSEGLDSRAMRQGAFRGTSSFDNNGNVTEAIVGTSGYLPENDEIVSRVLAAAVAEHAHRTIPRVATIAPAPGVTR